MCIKKAKNRLIVSVVLFLVIFLCQTAPAQVSPLVKTEKDSYGFGEMIKVIYFGAPGNEADWICIVPAGSADTEAGDYKYMPRGLSQGSLFFDSPTPGKYEARGYYDYGRRGYVVTDRYPFSVTSDKVQEEALAQYMERKIDPNHPLEANLPSGNGIVYIFREPVTGNPFADSTNVEVQVMANGKHLVVMPTASYFPHSIPAGDASFATGKLTQRNVHKNNIEEDVWSVRSGEATIEIKPGYVYYIKVILIPMGHLGSSLNQVPHQEGANMISSYKLVQIEK